MNSYENPSVRDVNNIFSRLQVYNTFFEENSISWWQRHIVFPIFFITAFIGYFIFSINWDFFDEVRNRMYDEMVVTIVDFGDFVPLKKRASGGSYVEIDEVFGNQYIKDKKKEFNPDRDIIDPRIGTAVNPVISNATAPIDLNPEIMPSYTAAARSYGIEGTVILELIISDEGEVLRARSVGKKLGYGLERMAIKCYEGKRYKPSIDSDGKKITVKIFQPVRFQLL
ncbi:MAG: TonB family protein [Spirochaetota bacterium]|nr:TonB family protein [Spirochaetota bacterium]